MRGRKQEMLSSSLYSTEQENLYFPETAIGFGRIQSAVSKLKGELLVPRVIRAPFFITAMIR